MIILHLAQQLTLVWRFIMYTYRTLENTAIETLHQAFLKAFSDYQVKMNLPLWKFQQMLVRRGYSADISMGAFDKDDMVGFILNGLRQWNNKLTVYDTGTGVILNTGIKVLQAAYL